MIKTPQTFLVIVEALFGQEWYAPASEALSVGDRSLRRWVAGQGDIPEGVWFDLTALCRKKAQELERLASEIAEPGFQTQVGEMRAPTPRR